MAKFKSDQIYRPDKESRDDSEKIGIWIPEALPPGPEKKAKPEARKAAEQPEQDSSDYVQRVRSWSPPKISKSEKVIRAGSSPAAPAKASDGALHRKQNVIRTDPAVRNSVAARPELAVYRIRNWFFEKSGSRSGGIYTVQPHLRIYIVLSLMGAAMIKTVYSIMSPSERKQIHQILKTDLRASAEEIETVKNEFLTMIREDLKNL